MCLQVAHRMSSLTPVQTGPDWARSLHLGHKETKQTTTERHRRHVERAERRKTTNAKLQEERVAAEEAVEEAVEEADGRAVESDGTSAAQDSGNNSKGVETEIVCSMKLIGCLKRTVS